MPTIPLYTLRVDHNSKCEHNPLGQEGRVTLIAGVQWKPHLQEVVCSLRDIPGPLASNLNPR